MADKNPSEIARETLRMLATSKRLPTPENYGAIYNEIAGIPLPQDPAKAFSAALAKHPSLELPMATRIEAAAAAGDWDKAATLLAKALSPPKAAEPDSTRRGSPLVADLHEQIARLIEFALPALGQDDAKIVPDAHDLALFCRQNAEFGSIAPLRSRLAGFNHRLSFVAEDQAEIKSSMLSMLHLVFVNIAELSLDDRWLHGQVELLMAASSPPLTLRRIDDLQARLQDLIFKQGELKQRHMEAQAEMTELLAFFIEKLSDMAELTGSHHDRIDACVKRIESSTDLSDVGPALAEALSATRVMAIDSLRARDSISALKQKTEDSAAEIERLRAALDHASEAARHDPLTGALNRRGLDESAIKESARAKRNGEPLCVALLDIDNFKIINDTHGHDVGDDALSHLAAVARESMRPQDTLSRYGGEEFVILMPDTVIEEAIVAMTRLQRELTRRFFMAGTQKILITFSAGVTQLGLDEDHQAGISRADGGMYQAKRSGKNKVVAT